MQYILASISYVIAGIGVVAVFIYIPFISDNAFWIILVSYIILGSNYVNIRPKPNLSLILAALSVFVALASVAAVFVYIPFLSNHAFWFLVLACVILGWSHFIIMTNLLS